MEQMQMQGKQERATLLLTLTNFDRYYSDRFIKMKK